MMGFIFMRNYFSYKVYRDGSIVNKDGHLLSQVVDKFGYAKVCLTINGKQKTERVHRVVAICYIENSEGKPFINHINGIKTDNDVSNLEWCTSSENMIHADKNGLRNINGEKNKSSKLTEKQVIEIRELKKSNSYTNTELSKMFNVSDSNISYIVKNKSWKFLS